MKRTDTTSSECKHTADAVSYLYGELSETETASFESHLLDCTDCTDEFASIAAVRYEVYDWKKLEFDPIATPSFEIPVDIAAPPSSWPERIGAAFGRGWAIPGLAFAGLAIVSIIAATFLLSSRAPNDIVANGVQTDNSATPLPGSSVAGLPSVDENGVAPSRDPEEVKLGQASSSTRPASRITVRNTKPMSSTRTQPKRAVTRVVAVDKAPTLNGFSDDEDTSIRLAELLDDGETRD